MSKLEIYNNPIYNKPYVRSTSRGVTFSIEEHGEYRVKYETNEGILCQIEVDGLYGLADENGRIVVWPKYYSIVNVFDDCFGAKEKLEDEGYALFRFDGTKITDFEWEYIFSDYDKDNNLILVSKDDRFRRGYINSKTGEVVVPPLYADLRQFKNGLAAVEDFSSTPYDLKWGAVNLEGKLVVPTKYCDPLLFEDDFAITRKKEPNSEYHFPIYVVVSKSGIEVIKSKKRIKRSVFKKETGKDAGEITYKNEFWLSGYFEENSKREYHTYSLKDCGDKILVREEIIDANRRYIEPEVDRYGISCDGTRILDQEIIDQVKKELG